MTTGQVLNKIQRTINSCENKYQIYTADIYCNRLVNMFYKGVIFYSIRQEFYTEIDRLLKDKLKEIDIKYEN